MSSEQPSAYTLPRALGEYAEADCARFHMPGHKGRGMGLLLPEAAARRDVTELSMTDNLHAPEGCIAQTQRAAARAYGARASFLLVNGSTAALQGMLLSLEPDDRLLLFRDCHRAALAAAGVDAEHIREILDCAACDDAVRILRECGRDAPALARVTERALFHLSHRADGMEVGLLMFSKEYSVLGQSENAPALLKKIMEE